MEFNTEIFSKFNNQWALLTAGNKEDFNMMTISWGGLGTLWNKPVATVYARKSRHTHTYLDNNEYFTISFFPEQYKDILGVMGSKSGRDMDKMTQSGLTAMVAGDSISFKEAEVTLVCKKMFKQLLDTENMPKEVAEQFYADHDDHDMYIGEVVDIIRK